MWKFDLTIQEWSSIPLQSTTIPIPRSEFGHARRQENMIMFGGKGEAELLNDLYTYNIIYKEWELISVQSTAKPTPRRASCLAASDEFFLLFGGVSGLGYTDELWKFNWGTRSYEHIIALNGPPKSAFYQCNIYTNQQNETIFQVYGGESGGESPIAIIYEYNLSTQQWIMIKNLAFNYAISRTKSAIFMVKDKLIVAGGSLLNYYARNYIDVLDLVTEDIHRVGYLPDNTYYAASVYYKNRIYIHGGGSSFGILPLKKLVRNDLIVIELNENCEPSPNLCISECSKGTYYNTGYCHLCNEGSYSDTIGQSSCKLCPSGYFSDIIGADSSRACKPCTEGYYGIEKGQSRCIECPRGSVCSFDQIKVETEGKAQSYSSTQPQLFVNETDTVDEAAMTFNTIIGIVLLIAIVLLLTFSRTRNFVTNLDLYSLKHNYGYEKVMYKRKTLPGGIFSLVFMVAALTVLFRMTLSYAIDNIIETKSLVPSEALEQKYKTVIFYSVSS